jgi:hypothetical protein
MHCALIQCYTVWLFTGVLKSDFTDCTTCGFELLLKVLFYCAERLDWVEGRACGWLVTGVTETHLDRLYIMTVNYMNLYSVNTSHIEIYLLNYSIVYSVEYMQYNTALFKFVQKL